MRSVWLILVACAGIVISCAEISAQSGLRESLKDIEIAPHWIYDDLPAALDQARATGKPVLAVFRCVPCPPGRTLDQQVMQPDDDLEELEKNFICVRVIQTNGLDLATFQFDYDMSWAAVFLNADRTIYGRYGTRTASGPASDAHLSRESFRKAAQRALELHRGYPGNRDQLAAKTGPAPDYPRPEQIPGLEDRGSRATTRQTCIHCHMVKEYTLRAKWEGNRLSPVDLWVYPMPDRIGLTIDAADGRRVQSVAGGSPAAQAGLLAGDELVSLRGQPLISLADIQWVLHTSADDDQVAATVVRNGQRLTATITLHGRWKESDIAWRASSWYGLRQGVKMDVLSAADKQRRGIAPDSMGLIVKNLVGKGGPKVQAAGLRAGDVVVGVDGRTKAMTESEFLAYLRLQHAPGDSVKLAVLRGEKSLEFTIPMW
jgi:serine protease Do